MFLSSKNIFVNDAMESEVLAFPSVSDLLQRSKNEVAEHPLTYLGVLYECCERFMDQRSQEYKLAMLSRSRALKSLYPPDLTEWLE